MATADEGAMAVAEQPRRTKKKKRAKRPRSEQSDLLFADSIRVEVRDRITIVEGRALTLNELAKEWHVHMDIARRYVRECALLGHVGKVDDRFIITPSSGIRQLEDFKRQTHAEVQRRRKEARDGYHAWRPDNVHTAQQSELLDWVEDQLKSRT